MNKKIKVATTKEKIAEIKREISKFNLIEKEYLNVEEKKRELRVKLSDILLLLDSKNKEINRLEKFSFAGAIKSIFIDKKKELEEKRDEYYNLSKEYDILKSEIGALEYESDILKNKYNKLLVLRMEFDALKKQREEELLHENSIDAITFRNVLDDISGEQENLSNIKVNYLLIDKLKNKLTLFSAALREVQGYGHWTNRRRRRRSSSYKEIAIKNAKQYYLESTLLIRKLQQSIYDFDLKDFNIQLKKIEFDSLLNIFFDNLITDIILSKKINEAVNNVDEVYNDLKILKSELIEKEENIKMKIKDLEEVKGNLLI